VTQVLAYRYTGSISEAIPFTSAIGVKKSGKVLSLVLRTAGGGVGQLIWLENRCKKFGPPILCTEAWLSDATLMGKV
jgi:hypothetical protein